MKILKNKKIFLNLILLMISVLPFFVLIGKFIDLGSGVDPYYSFYHFLNNEKGIAGNISFLLLIIANFGLTTYAFVDSLIAKTYKKSIKNIIVFSILILLNIAIIVLSFFLGKINDIEKIITIIPMMVSMLGFLSLIFLAMRFALELLLNE